MREAQEAVLHTTVLGLNHITASVEVRDHVHFDTAETEKMAGLLTCLPEIEEAVIISTCNRSEIYVATSNPETALGAIKTNWATLKGLNPEIFETNSYQFVHREAVTHLLKVACSLDSMIIGENQILGQLKEAYQYAVEIDSVGYFFNYLFQLAFKVGKRVRSETRLNEGAVSISYAAVELAKKVLGQKLKDKRVAVVGSGEMGQLATGHLKRTGVGEFYFYNRSLSNAEKLASEFGGQAFSLDKIPESLHECDIIVSATGAREIIITEEIVRQASSRRHGTMQFYIDIAAPRDIEAGVENLENTFLFTIDDLKKAVGENLELRRESAEQAKTMVEEEVDFFENWYSNLNVAGVLRQINLKFKDLLETELEIAKNKNPEAASDIELFGRALIKKILHPAFSGIKELSQQGQGKKISQFAEKIFGLIEKDTTPSQKETLSENKHH